MITGYLNTLNSSASRTISPDGAFESAATAAETADHGIIAGLNNAGISFLTVQREDLASDLFRFALQFATGRLGLVAATQVFQRAISWHQQETGINHERGAGGPGNGNAAASLSFLTGPQHEIPSGSPLLTSLPFVHTEGIPLIPSSTAFSTDVLLSTTITSSILMFNMGVAYHLHALRGGSIDLQHVANARSLYLKSLFLLRASNIITETSTGGVHPVLDLLILALCNNLGQASYEAGAYAEAGIYFSRMVHYATTVDDSALYADDAIAAVMVHHHKSSLLLNAMILHPPSVAPAA